MRWSPTLGALCLVVLGAGPAEARGRAGEIVSEALDYVKEAAELNEDEDSRCQGKLAGRLGAVEERLRDLRQDPGRSATQRAVAKLEDAMAFAGEQCPPRLSGGVRKRLGKAVARLQQLRDVDDDRDYRRDDRDYRRDRDERRDRDDRDERRGFSVQGSWGAVTSAFRGDRPRAPEGPQPMARGAFQGFLGGLQSNPNEILRKDQCLSLLQGNYISAAQLGQMMDLFNNEILKLDVARAAAPKVVDPQNALGHSGKFHNGILARDYTALMSKERR